jgi:hypothetical protein
MRDLACVCTLAALLAVTAGCGGSGRPQAQLRPATSYPRYRFLPRGILTLAEGRAPHGPAFAIKVERYRFQGKLHTDLEAQMEPHAKLGGASGSFSPRSREPFEWSTEQGCSTTATWSILYGLLRDRSDQGVLFVGTRRQRLRTAPIPARFHLPGAAGYAALTRNPTRVRVTDRAGRVVQDEDLGHPPGEHCTPGESASLMVLRTKG